METRWTLRNLSELKRGGSSSVQQWIAQSDYNWRVFIQFTCSPDQMASLSVRATKEGDPRAGLFIVPPTDYPNIRELLRPNALLTLLAQHGFDVEFQK